MHLTRQGDNRHIGLMALCALALAGCMTLPEGLDSHHSTFQFCEQLMMGHGPHTGLRMTLSGSQIFSMDVFTDRRFAWFHVMLIF